MYIYIYITVTAILMLVSLRQLLLPALSICLPFCATLATCMWNSAFLQSIIPPPRLSSTLVVRTAAVVQSYRRCHRKNKRRHAVCFNAALRNRHRSQAPEPSTQCTRISLSTIAPLQNRTELSPAAHMGPRDLQKLRSPK